MKTGVKSVPKIRGYVATTKNKIVLLYRRSKKVTYLVLLSYTKHKASVQIGSRFYGRMYPNRCDISSDGTYFLYFAMGSSPAQYKKPLYCWTGICMPPSITANKLFAHGDTWGGGGRFLDDKTLFISPGMYPDFDTAIECTFDKYQIAFDGSREDGGWNSGKGWTLSATQVDPGLGDKYPIPKYWTKMRGKTALFKYLNYVSPKSSSKNRIGEYDLHRYEVNHERTGVKRLFGDSYQTCQWVDFDNLGRLIIASGSEVSIYKSIRDIIDSNATQTFDLEEMITLKECASRR